MRGGGGASSFSSPSILSMSLHKIISLAFVDEISRAMLIFFSRVSVGSESPHWCMIQIQSLKFVWGEVAAVLGAPPGLQ